MMNIHKELPLSFPGCPPSPDPSPPFTQISRHYRWVRSRAWIWLFSSKAKTTARVTVGLDTPTSRQIADPDRPSAEQRTMLALSTTRCGVVRLFTNRSKRLRSPRRNRILRTGSPMRGIYRMYLLCKRFLLYYTR